ncbi:MAG: hypothetical protein AAGI15_12575 [Pseudomonadota bacterium]
MLKLQSQNASTSFYEAFSDLIFATLAIMVLLMIVFLIQINLDIGIEALEQQLAETQGRFEQRQEALAEANEQNAKLKRSEQAMKQYNIELAIAVDVTGSMQLELNQLADTIGLVGKILPRIANKVRIGVVAYRKDEQNQVRTAKFPMQRIYAPESDSQRSFRRLHAFVRGLRARPGSAPLEQAVDTTLKMFAPTSSFNGHQAFMLLGDVGPYEDRYRDQTIDAANRRQERAMQRQLQVWAKASDHRNVLILFTGEDEITKTRGAQNQKFISSRAFFEKLAAAAEQPDGYSNNYSEMIPLLLSTALN